MSSLRKALPRREHKERHQLEQRKHLGLLEKKKDYKLRAKDYHRKQDFLKQLQLKASLRNEDEFYFKMIKSRTNKGVHEQDRTEKFDHESQKLMKTQDLNYLRIQQQMNDNRLKRMKLNNYVEFQGQHVKFGSNSKIVSGIKTDGDKVDQQYKELTAEETKTSTTNPTFKSERKRFHLELEARETRQQKLKEIFKEMEIQKQLMLKGKKHKVGEDDKGLPIYKWKSVRKR